MARLCEAVTPPMPVSGCTKHSCGTLLHQHVAKIEVFLSTPTVVTQPPKRNTKVSQPTCSRSEHKTDGWNLQSFDSSVDTVSGNGLCERSASCHFFPVCLALSGLPLTSEAGTAHIVVTALLNCLGGWGSTTPAESRLRPSRSGDRALHDEPRPANGDLH